MRSFRSRVHAERLSGVGVGGTVLLHCLAVAFVLAAPTSGRPRPLAVAYRVELIAGAPPAAAASPVPTRPSEARPSPPPAEPKQAASRPPAPSPPAPARAAPREPAVPAREPAVPRPTPSAGSAAQPATAPAPGSAAPGATPGPGADPATVRTEGVEFPFPGYLRNLVAQVYRRWHPPSGNMALEAEVFFFVHRDGSISGLQFVRRSGSFAFDLEAQGAVEAAARASAFGALPAGYGADVLPVSFFFSPRSLR